MMGRTLWALALSLSLAATPLAGCGEKEGGDKPAEGKTGEGKTGEGKTGEAEAAAPAKKDPRSSKEALIEAGLQAIKDGSGDDYAKLMINADIVKTHCAAMAEKMGEDKMKAEFAEMAKKAAQRIAERCTGVDWTKAKQTGIEGGEERREAKECPGIFEHKDIEVTFDIEGDAFVVSLEDPFFVKAAGVWGFSRPPRCKGGSAAGAGAMIRMAESARDAICKCDTSECAKDVMQKFAKDAGKMAADMDPSAVDPEVSKQMGEITSAMSKCMGDAMKKEAGAP